MGKANKSWHWDTLMPKNATVQERIEWHLAHAEACGCPSGSTVHTPAPYGAQGGC
jgi:hypothetical protein